MGRFLSKAKPPTTNEERQAIRARQELLGRALQKAYEEVLEEPVPADFLELLEQIEAKAQEAVKPAPRESE